MHQKDKTTVKKKNKRECKSEKEERRKRTVIWSGKK